MFEYLKTVCKQSIFISHDEKAWCLVTWNMFTWTKWAWIPRWRYLLEDEMLVTHRMKLNLQYALRHCSFNREQNEFSTFLCSRRNSVIRSLIRIWTLHKVCSKVAITLIELSIISCLCQINNYVSLCSCNVNKRGGKYLDDCTVHINIWTEYNVNSKVNESHCLSLYPIRLIRKSILMAVK